MEWKRTDVNMPDDDVLVLVYVPDASEPLVWPAYCNEDEEWRYVDGGTCYPTHWMPLPEPPAN